MKKIVLIGPRQFDIQEGEIPKPGEGEVLIRIHKVGICGSDIHLYRDAAIGTIKLRKPIVIGHECMGVVEEVGEGVSPTLKGKRVAIEPSISCNHCRWCKKGHQNLCQHNKFLGLPPHDGALQEYIAHPSELVEVLPDSLSEEDGVVLEPMAVALHAVHLLKIQPGETIVIMGTGVLGTCVLSLLKLYKGIKIICVDVIQDRLDRALSMDADHVVLAKKGDKSGINKEVIALTGGLGAEKVFECSGSADTLWNMCNVACLGGHIAVIGTSPEDRVSFSSGSARRKGLTLRFVRRSLNTLAPCIELAKEGLIQPGKLVTHTFKASEVPKAFETVYNHKDGVLKALIDMTSI